MRRSVVDVVDIAVVAVALFISIIVVIIYNTRDWIDGVIEFRS
jgi:hypothetical protein